MSEKEIIELQQESGKRYLLQVGMFYHAYEGAAFVLARLTGYRIRRVHRRKGEVLMLGFNVSQIDHVKEKLEAEGISLHAMDEKGTVWWFEGGDATPDPQMVTQTFSKHGVGKAARDDTNSMLLNELLEYNLSQTTPIEAMMFLSSLQQKYGKY